MLRTLLSAVFCLLVCASAKSQSEGGLVLTAGAEKKLSRQMSVELGAGFRSRNDFKTIDRWSGSIGLDYKLTKWLKADASYTLLYNNHREKISYHYSNSGLVTGYNKWRPSYWGVRHRVKVSLSAEKKLWSILGVSLRERWQYTYRPEQTATRWDFDNSKWEDKVRSGKAKSQLRSKLQVAYDKKRAVVRPYAYVEFYNSWEVEKMSYSVGTDIKLSKQHSFDLSYQFQSVKNIDEADYDPSMHYIIVGYKFKF